MYEIILWTMSWYSDDMDTLSRGCSIKFGRNSSEIRCYVGVREILFACINVNTLLDNHRERYRKFLQVTFRHDLDALDAVTMTIHYACVPRSCSTRMIRKWQWSYKLLYATSISLSYSKQFFIGRLDALRRIVQIPKDASLQIHEISLRKKKTIPVLLKKQLRQSN